MNEQTYDVIVIGAGPAGEVLAGRMAQKGRDVAIVEADLVGGECSFYACMPSKALLRPAEALAETRRVPGAAQAAAGELDVQAVLARRDEIIGNLDDTAQLPWLESRGVTLIRGHGRLDGERRVRVGADVYEAREAVVIATGSAAAIPPVPGLAGAKPWTNREVTTAAEVPNRLIILGGGVVGVEMAQAYATLGATVTVIEAGPRLLGREEPFAGEDLRVALIERGVDVRLDTRAESVRRDGEVTVSLTDGSIVTGDEILVAIGRRPLTDDVGLETVGLDPGRTIEVDDRLMAPGLPWLYAIGDVNGRSLLTHSGKYQAHVLSEILDGAPSRARSDGASAPRVVFTEPQVAAVGLTLQGALDLGVDARAYDVSSSATAGASFHGRETGGTSRIVVDERRGVIVGATFTGADVADWLHAATIAIVSETPIERLWDAVPAFPTRSEIWLKLLEQREGELAAAAGEEGATFAAGCFWGVEAAFREIEGVLETAVGYAGGRSPNPTYEDVCHGETGHAEAVDVRFDPAVISYEQLLEVFWGVHDPTTPDRQGWDFGSQYRSAIFTRSPEQQAAAISSRDARQRALGKQIVTEIVPATGFHRAEEYHQRYFEKHGGALHCALTLR